VQPAESTSSLVQPASRSDPWVRRLVLLFAVLGAFFMAVACVDWPSANLPSSCGNCRRQAWVELLTDSGLSCGVVLLNWLIAIREVPEVARWARCAAGASLAMWGVAWVFVWIW
jgi:hypothetical protein